MALSDETASIGLFGIGLETYWDQFPGLRDRLNGHQSAVCQRLRGLGVHVVDAGLVDNPRKSQPAADLFRREKVDLVFLFISTYALSSTVLPVAQLTKAPVVVLNLQPIAQLDYDAFNQLKDRGTMTGVWLEHCQACCLPEITNVFTRAGITYSLVSGFLDDPEAWNEIQDWVEAAAVFHRMKQNRIGVLGNYYGGMLDVYSDLTKESIVFGSHFEVLEMCELHSLWTSIPPLDMVRKREQFVERFDVAQNCDQRELDRAARTSCALDALVERHALGSMAYYYEGVEGNEYQNIVTSMIPGNTILTANHVPVAGEYEIKNVQAMKILDLFGAGGSFSEFYLVDYRDDVIYLGHDGPAHPSIAEGRVGLVPLPVYHGKPGKGLSLQMTVRHGPVTLLSVVEGPQGELFLLTAEGESVEGPTLQIGNTNSRYRFPCGVRTFMRLWAEAGPAHHCAVGVGHLSQKIAKFARLCGISHRHIS
jgi:L-arabinose isomerase